MCEYSIIRWQIKGHAVKHEIIVRAIVYNLEHYIM